MGFYHREIKFYVIVLYLDIHTKTTKLLNKSVLDQKVALRFKIAAILDLRGCCLTSSSFQPVKQIGF